MAPKVKVAPKITRIEKVKVVPVVKAKVVAKAKAPKKDVGAIEHMTLTELKTKRIEIAEQINTSGVHWDVDKEGNYTSRLDQTDYWKIVERINTF